MQAELHQGANAQSSKNQVVELVVDDVLLVLELVVVVVDVEEVLLELLVDVVDSS